MSTIAPVSFQHATGSASSSTVAIAAILTAGDPIAVIVVSPSGQSVTGISDGANTYTLLGTQSNPHLGTTFTVYKCAPTAGGSKTITAAFSATTAYPWIGVMGATYSSGVDTFVTNYQASTGSSTDAITTGTALPSTQPGLIFGFVHGPGATSPGSGFSFDAFANDGTNGTNFSVSWSTEYKRYTSASAIAATWTEGDSPAYVTSIAVLFKESTAATAKSARNYYEQFIRGC